jgi:dTDP-4-dehydrorhamnose reductase
MRVLVTGREGQVVRALAERATAQGVTLAAEAAEFVRALEKRLGFRMARLEIAYQLG